MNDREILNIIKKRHDNTLETSKLPGVVNHEDIEWLVNSLEFSWSYLNSIEDCIENQGKKG